MSDVMLDLETMGNGSNSAIVAIGAVRFANGKITNEFYEIVDLQSCVDAGLEIDAGTVIWWMQQSDEARKQITRKGLMLDDVLLRFSDWMNHWVEPKVWGCGAAFDNVILSNAYKKLGMEVPWKFWNDRCYRTIKAEFPNVPVDRVGTHHNALDDAKTQAVHLIDIMSRKHQGIPVVGHVE